MRSLFILTTTLKNLGAIEEHLLLGGEGGDGTIGILHGLLVVVTLHLDLSQTIDGIEVVRLLAQNHIEVVLGNLEVALLEGEFRHHVDAVQGRGLEGESPLEIGILVVKLIEFIVEFCTQHQLVEEEVGVLFGSLLDALGDIGKRILVLTVKVILISASETDLVVVRVVGKVLIVDTHDSLVDFPLQFFVVIIGKSRKAE